MAAMKHTNLPGDGRAMPMRPTEESEDLDGRLSLAREMGKWTMCAPGSEGGSFDPT